MQNVRAIVDDVSFAIEEKDRIALVGVNGTGKSTLLRVIAGKEKADSGTITYRRGAAHFHAGSGSGIRRKLHRAGRRARWCG